MDRKEQKKRTEKAYNTPWEISEEEFRGCWRVRNLVNDHVYTVCTLNGEKWSCTCPDFVNFCNRNGLRCKHIEAVRLHFKGKRRVREMEKSFTEALTRLAEPFPAEAVQWKPQVLSKDHRRCLAVAYIEVRDVFDRLDDVVGPAGWQTALQVVDGIVYGGIGIRNPQTGEWVWKWDCGEISSGSEMKAKGDVSDAYKRAGVQWGIGRYLYRLPRVWCDYDEERRQIINPPQLPEWALPSGKAVDAQEAGEGRRVEATEKSEIGPEIGPTDFWRAVYEKGLSREEGQKLLEEAGGWAGALAAILAANNKNNN
jgi:hypothetical protein